MELGGMATSGAACPAVTRGETRSPRGRTPHSTALPPAGSGRAFPARPRRRAGFAPGRPQKPALQSRTPARAPPAIATLSVTGRRSFVPASILVGVAGLVGVAIVSGPTRRIAKIAEEVRIRLDHEPRVVRPQARFVGLHRAIEAEKAGVMAIGVGENPVAFGVACAPHLFGF